MILEVDSLNVIPDKLEAFEKDFSIAQEIISSMKGYQWHQLQKCIEVENKYLLLVQ